MSHTIAVLGLPQAGKSVWLGRLWHAIEHERRALRKRGAPRDLTGLHALGDPLADGVFSPRTSAYAPPAFRAPLRWEGDVRIDLDLDVADYNGEQVQHLWSARADHWDAAWDRRALGDGLAIVIRADLVRSPRHGHRAVPALRVDEPARRLFPDAQPDGAVSGDDTPTSPSAVELIELLQLLRHARGLAAGEVEPGWRAAILLAAWDAVDPGLQELGPEVFLQRELALLDDVLACNFRRDDVRAFGLSAVGGDLWDRAYQARFLEGEVDDHGWLSWQRGSVRRSEDITLPIGWLLRGDVALPEGEPWAR